LEEFLLSFVFPGDMRLEALNYLACPNCGSELTLRNEGVREENEHIMEGALECSACKTTFSIRNGVPILMPANLENVKIETASRFAEEFFDWIAPVTGDDFKGQTVFEGGCGKGRHTAIVAGHGAKAVVSLDLGESAFVAFAHTRDLPNAHVVIGDLLHPPVKPIFDMAFSVGVLHHLPDPAAGFASLASRVRNGGRVFFWVYGYEGNEWIPRFINPIRTAVTSKLPAGLLRVLCLVPSAFLWIVIKLFYRPGADGKGPKHLPYGDYFAAMHSYPFDEVHANVFDQLVTPVAYYLKEEEVWPWLASGFKDKLLRSQRGYSWTGLASVDRH
jgi:SAM-dependent methyltransferase